MPAQICFRNHRPLPGEPAPPTIDGFVEPEDFLEVGFGTTASDVDTGWTEPARITYVADVSVGAGRPLMVFQCLKDRTTDFVYLSFVVRRDTQFHDQDCIVLVFRPSFPAPGASKDGTERRIDIFPNSVGVGAGVPDGLGTALRENRDPRNVEYYRWDTTGSGAWQSMPAINNASIKVRSWDLGTNNRNWSVELKLPTTVAQGGANWIDLSSSFGFYFNVIRLCSGPECSFDPTPFDGGSFQFTWPRADYVAGTGLIQNVVALDAAPIPLAWLGQAHLGDGPGCAGVAGVKFENGANSIGILSGGAITNDIHRTNPNTFVARVVNNATIDAAPAVRAEFRIANWGMGPGDNAKWNLIPATGGTSNPTTGTDIPVNNVPVDLTMEWDLDPAEEAMYGTPPAQPLSKHQCIWVLLDSVQAVDFVESSKRRNCDFIPLSEEERVAEISGEGYPSPADDGPDHDITLIVSQMRRGRLVPNDQAQDFVARSQTRQTAGTAFGKGEAYVDSGGGLGQFLALLRLALRSYRVVYEWVWITDGYRKTQFAVTVAGKDYQIYEPIGAFGHIADHEGLVSTWEQSVSPVSGDASRFEQAGPDAYRLRVPDGGKFHVVTRLAAQEYRVPWWIWLLLLLLLVLIIYLLVALL